MTWVKDNGRRPARPGGWLRRGSAAAGHGLALCGLMIVELLAMVAVLCVVVLCALGVGLALLPATAGAVRALTDNTRRLAGRWCGVDIPGPRRMEPSAALPASAGAPGQGWRRRLGLLAADPATWRDLAWLTVDPLVGWLLALAPAALIAWGLFGLVMPYVWQPIADAHGNNWYGFIHVDGTGPAWLSVPLGAAAIVLAVAAAPWLLHQYGRLARALLGAVRPASPRVRASRTPSTLS